MFSQTVEYALRAIICLAHEAPTVQNSKRLAEMTDVPQSYLAKVMLSLNRAGLVDSQRGPHGGFSLTKDPKQLSVLEVVNAVEPIRRIHECPMHIEGHETNLCPLHRTLDDVMAMAEKVSRETTVAEVLAKSSGSFPLCSNRSGPIVELKSDR